MEIGIKTLAGIVVGVALVAAASTKYYWPSIQEKTQTIEKEVVKTDVVTVTKEVVRTDGSKEIVTTTTDKSVKKSDTKETEVKMADPKQADLLLTAGIVSDFREKPDYMIGISKRVLGPAFVGVTYQTNNTYGLTVTLQF